MAKAYLAGFLKIRDPGWLDEYRPKTLALVEKHGGRYLAVAPPERLEGQNTPDVLVIMEFPSMEAVKAWYSDPEYQPLIRLRQSGSDMEFVAADGLV